jgi:hypothetical protein
MKAATVGIFADCKLDPFVLSDGRRDNEDDASRLQLFERRSKVCDRKTDRAGSSRLCAVVLLF